MASNRLRSVRATNPWMLYLASTGPSMRQFASRLVHTLGNGAQRAKRWPRKAVLAAPAGAMLFLTAMILASFVVSVQSMITGDTRSQAIWTLIAGGAIPIIGLFAPSFQKLFELVRGRKLIARNLVELALLSVLLSGLGFTQSAWLPGMLNHCYTLPTSNGMTEFARARNGECYGFIDHLDGGLFSPGTFGNSAVSASLQRAVLTQNRPQAADDVTVVWLGALSCIPEPKDPRRCIRQRDYPSERDQLRGLLMAQHEIASTTRHRLHVVIANAGLDVAHADDVARLIIANRTAFGRRLVVVGGGDSRDVTQQAINRLLDNGIPVIAPQLIADLGKPGAPWIQRPGYLQLAPPNTSYAKAAIARLSRSYPHGFRLDIFQLPVPSDQYTNSLLNDLQSEVKNAPIKGVLARHVNSLNGLDSSICRDNSRGSSAAPRTRTPRVVYFADRWTSFGAFIRRINDVCGFSPPEKVYADGSASRFMANNSLRTGSNAIWPLDYFAGGPGCQDLSDPTILRWGSSVPGGSHFTCSPNQKGSVYCTLDAATSTSQPCTPNDLGWSVAPTYDAALLADKLMSPTTKQFRAATELRQLHLATLHLSVGDVAVQAGWLCTPNKGKPCTSSMTAPLVPPIPMVMWHIDQLDNPTAGPRLLE